jgi:hypothetical protein
MPKVLAGIENTMSPARLARFSPPNGDKNQGLRTYVWNARLCEEFYIPLQLTEIAFRNGVHRRLQDVYETDWHVNPKFLTTVPQRHRTDLQEVFANEKAKRGPSLTVDHIVSGLPFGFWHSLMGQSVQHILWKYGVRGAFPHLPMGENRQTVFNRLELMQKFRNAVMHHYAIFDKLPMAEYQNLLTLLEWMCPNTLWLVKDLSNPAAIIQKRPQF